MTVFVHFSGPSYSQTAILEPGAAPVDVGRDPQATIHLPDNERLISRRHISLEWSEGGVKVTVLSKVNGLATPRGEFTLGQTVVLAPGESAQLGRFSFVVEHRSIPAATNPRHSSPPADDPFALFGAPASACGLGSVFEDPFFAAPARPTPAMDMSAALDAISGKPALGAASFSGASPSPALDPLAAFGGNQLPAHSSVSIDEFLGTPSPAASGLGAASLLRPVAQAAVNRLATDHVHDFRLPVRPPSVQVTPFLTPATPTVESVDPIAAFANHESLAVASRSQSLERPAAHTLASAAGGADPWSNFASEWLPPDAAAEDRLPPVSEFSSSPLIRAFDDAFSSSTAWHVDQVPVPAADPLAGAFIQSDAAIEKAFSEPGRPDVETEAGAGAEATLRALCKGLGVSGPSKLQEKEWEQFGHSIRQIVQGLSDLMNVRAELKRELRAADRTMLGAQENNPLKSGMPLEELLHYLLFMPQGAAGYMPVQRALEESITDLRAHEFASLAAVRAVVEGSIKEFEPAKLRTTLLQGKRSIAAVVDNARLWDLYATYYANRREHLADWLEQVFNRHFMPAYSRESERLRREAQAQQSMQSGAQR